MYAFILGFQLSLYFEYSAETFCVFQHGYCTDAHTILFLTIFNTSAVFCWWWSMNDERAQGFWKMLSLNAFWGKAMKSGSQFGPHLLFHWLCEEFQQLVVVDQCMSAIKTHCNNYMARLEPCHCCPDCNYNYCYKTETTAVEPTHLDYLIDEAHMSDRVSLLHQNLLQMLHLRNMQQRNLHTIFISLADRVELRFWCVNEQSVMAGQSVGIPVYTQHISGPSVSPGWSTEQREKLQCCLVSVALLCPVHLGEDVS